MSVHDITDTRLKAAAILSGRKLQMLEDAGLVVMESTELERLRKIEAAAKEILANWQMGRLKYWQLYSDPPEEFLKLHDAFHPDASDGREWELVERAKIDRLRDVAAEAKAIRDGYSETRWEEFCEAVDALEAMERG